MQDKLQQTKRLMLIMIAGLFISGLTVFPMQTELTFLLKIVPNNSSIYQWIRKIGNDYSGIHTYAPQILYGFDWLGFAHFVLAILFIGPYKDPVKNIWVVQFGMIACVLIFPLAFIAGYFRQIPFGWQMIDCSFGVTGYIILHKAYKNISFISQSSNSIIYGNRTDTNIR